MISVIIPTYNEADSISPTLNALSCARGDFEVIVADGSSEDGTREVVESMIPGYPHPLRVITAARHRALQVNAAAEVARGNTFLFLHADIAVPNSALESLQSALHDPSLIGGNFQIIFEGTRWVEHFFTWAYRVRRPFGIYYGDSGVFIRREAFERLEGFKAIPIMDDYEFIRRMERMGHAVCLEPALTVSDRRWRVQGLLPTLVSWVWIQTLYSLGVPARYLARWYGPVRNRSSRR